jgi:hypothetical protein
MSNVKEYDTIEISRNAFTNHLFVLQFPKRKDLDDHVNNTLLDGEMIQDTVNGKNVPRYLVYDIVKFEVRCDVWLPIFVIL